MKIPIKLPLERSALICRLLFLNPNVEKVTRFYRTRNCREFATTSEACIRGVEFASTSSMTWCMKDKTWRMKEHRSSNKRFYCYFDGGSRPFEMIAGAGAVIYMDEGEGEEKKLSEIWSSFFRLPSFSSNNVAEYTGLILGLKKCVELQLTDLTVKGDSELIVKQIRKEYKVLHPNLIILHAQATSLIKKLPEVPHFEHIPRKQNFRADELSNQAMNQPMR